MAIEINRLSVNLGKRIKIERIKHEISQEKLAEQADVHRTTLSKIERGEVYPTIDTVAKIANALNMSFAEILNFDF